MKNQITLIVVAKWQQFMNSRHIEEMLQLTDDQIKFFGLFEPGVGHEELTDWIERNGIYLSTLISSVNEDKLLLKQQVKWKRNDGSVIGERHYYTYILMENSKIIYIGLFENLHDAEVMSGISLIK